VPSQFVVLDESKSEKHPILSVGGIIVNGDDIPEIERKWAAMKRAAGFSDRPVKYAMTWPDRSVRIHFMEQIGELRVRAVAALLEDFRPLRMKTKRETRSEAYVHLHAFEYVLQRLPESIYRDDTCAPNFVLFDHRDDFSSPPRTRSSAATSGSSRHVASRRLRALASYPACTWRRTVR
jgi:hypothetical protein